MIYYVLANADLGGDGTREKPFQTISEAAKIAIAGDTVVIGDGIYREWVSPENGGTDDSNRITFINDENAAPIISGAEILDGWKQQNDKVWFCEVGNEIFGDYNPYSDFIFGDWYNKLKQEHHTGEVFFNGEAMYEVLSLEGLQNCKRPSWYAEIKEKTTAFYCNFLGKKPARNLVEISVRPYCFFPKNEGVSYITVSGLELRQAATQWAPPTAFQPGLIGPHWSRGWIIENCKIHDSKCSGVSLGKRLDVSDNLSSKNATKDGTQNYIEIVFTNLNDGYSGENVGGHIVRNNEIYNCGQTGVVGCMGCAFSTVQNNHIHHINIRGEFSGAEVAGIKLHSAIDVVVEKNIIHDCSRGLWLDWQAQGAAVRKNIFFRNEEWEDLFIEVCHGPCTVENNIFLSSKNFFNVSQGTALVHNIFAGRIQLHPDRVRYTFYHVPHSTKAQGMVQVFGGDDRYINNIFIGKGAGLFSRFQNGAIQNKITQHHILGSSGHGTNSYDGYRSWADEDSKRTNTALGTLQKPFPVTMKNNVYFNGTKPYKKEISPVLSKFKAKISIAEKSGHYYLHTNLGEILESLPQGDIVTTDVLGKAFEPDQRFENRDGSPIAVDSDFFDAPRGAKVSLGAFEKIAAVTEII